MLLKVLCLVYFQEEEELKEAKELELKEAKELELEDLEKEVDKFKE